MSTYRDDNRILACVYSSDTGLWGNPISTEAPCGISAKPESLVCNTLYWLSFSDGMLELDLDKNSLTMIMGLPATYDISCEDSVIIPAEDGALGFAAISFLCLQMWSRNVNGHGVATWVPWKTIAGKTPGVTTAMHTLLGLPSQIDIRWLRLLGYEEDTGAVFLLMGDTVYMVQLKSMQSRKLHKICYTINHYYPFTSFYTPGTAIADGSNGAEFLHNT
ncbi:unnamed protein product [Alopecurus aequalis]